MGYALQNKSEDGRAQRELHWRFTCNSPHAAAIVAVVNLFDGQPFNWACYWGGGSPQNELACVETVRETGNKLEQSLAEYLFPDLKDIDYRH